MRHKLTLAIAATVLAAAALPAAASDKPLSYTYFEAGYSQTQVDGLDQVLDSDHLNGYGAALSYGHDNGLILFGSYGTTSKDVAYAEPDFSIDGDIDLDRFRFGVGYAFPITPRVHWVTKAAYESNTLGVGATADYIDDLGDPATGTLSGEIDANGYSLETGVRARLGNRFDAYVGVGRLRMDDPTISDIEVDGDVYEGSSIDLDALGVDRSETYGAVGLQFDIAGSWSLVGQAALSSDVNTYFIGVRSSLY